MNTNPLAAVVFDLDDTLYPERDYVRSGYEAVAAYLRQTLGRDEPLAEWLWRRFCSGQSQGAFDALSAEFGLGLDAEGIQRLVKVYREHRPRIELVQGAADLLRRLRVRVRLGLLTDGYLPAQRLKIAALGLEGLFDAVVLTEEMGRDCWKPSPAGFEAIARKLAAPAPACTYVADNPAKDFLAPNRLGWRTIQLRRPDQIHADNPAPSGGEPQVVLHDLGELERLLP